MGILTQLSYWSEGVITTYKLIHTEGHLLPHRMLLTRCALTRTSLLGDGCNLSVFNASDGECHHFQIGGKVNFAPPGVLHSNRIVSLLGSAWSLLSYDLRGGCFLEARHWCICCNYSSTIIVC